MGPFHKDSPICSEKQMGYIYLVKYSNFWYFYLNFKQTLHITVIRHGIHFQYLLFINVCLFTEFLWVNWTIQTL